MYQNALKLHSQGPAFFAEADAAYQELFKSEVFSYPESLSESKWLETYADADIEDDVEDLGPEISGLAAGADVTPSSLPQILYLAYKNFGQFRLDKLRYRLTRLEKQLLGDQKPHHNEIDRATNTGLEHLTEAISRDESDLELWRTVSRLAEYLGSPRVARYCLEAVLDDYDILQNDQTGALGLEERFALERLRLIISRLDDVATKMELQGFTDNVKTLSKNLSVRVDPCPFLPEDTQRMLSAQYQRKVGTVDIDVAARSWVSIGKALLQHLQQRVQGTRVAPAGTWYTLKVPDTEGQDLDRNSVLQPESIQALPQRSSETSTQLPVAQIDPSPIIGPDQSHLSDAQRIDVPSDEQAVEPPVTEPLSAGLEKDSLEMRTNEPEAEALTAHGPLSADVDQKSLPTRKRSSDEADLVDPNDALRGRSKRIKARNEIAESGPGKGQSAEEWAKWYRKQLEIYEQADNLAFQFIDDISGKFGRSKLGSVEYLRNICTQASEMEGQESLVKDSSETPVQALKRLLDRWDLVKSRTFLSGGGLQDPIKGAQVFGLSSFLEHSMQETSTTIQRPVLPSDLGLQSFIAQCQGDAIDDIELLGVQWLFCLLAPISDEKGDLSSLYESHSWPDPLKETVVHLLVLLDDYISSNIQRGYLKPATAIVQSIFEIHLDVYSRITNPSSVVDEATRALQRDRLCRWSGLASELVDQYADDNQEVLDDQVLRFLWATVICKNVLDKPSSEHSVLCYHDLIHLLSDGAKARDGRSRAIYLVNNAVMPEVSTAVAEREISRLTTMDFFAAIFDSSDKDPFAVIERLEPLLQLSIAQQEKKATPICDDGGQSTKDPSNAIEHDSTLGEALRFLDRASISLRLILWQRLRDAYGVINYPSMILSCNLRSLALIVEHISSPIYKDMTQNKNVESFLQWIGKIDELLTSINAVVLTDANAFECIDDDHIRSLMDTIVSLRKVLHVFAMWEDSIRVGQISAPAQPGSAAAKPQTKSADKFREMIVKAWTLHYLFIREAMKQNPGLISSPDESLLTYLRISHYALGIRTYCGLASKMFLKLAKSEMLRLKPAEGWDTDMPQIIQDLFGLKISSATSDTVEHVCDPIDIDKMTALEILDIVMIHVNRLSMKDLLKSDLRFAVDKLQLCIKVPRLVDGTSTRSFNKRLVNVYLKSPINPVDLYRSLRGIGGLGSTLATSSGCDIAQRGWYFLLGHIALFKFKSQKRTTAGSTEDLENAKVFFKLDLEFGTEKWETWYRLAQVFDALLDEQTTWTAEKIDPKSASLIELQRHAILSYNMALANAGRFEDASFEDVSKMADLHKDFGLRLYSSSREPFCGEAFNLDDFERPYNRDRKGMYKKPPFAPLNSYRAWKFASAMLQQASRQKPNDWFLYYSLAKVQWKMYQADESALKGGERLHYQTVLGSLTRAIESLPDKRDGRHTEKDPILEPHYKVLSIMHKLVRMGRVSAQEACLLLKATPYARRIPAIQDPEEWVDYMQEVLKALRSADKSNWHHRMVVRAAVTIYETDPNDIRTWLGARHELAQQIFTKTMTIQVWKPEHERSGRHFVYTSRYVTFLLEILQKLKDKENVEALAKRIRKKGGDFFRHGEVWQHLTYLYLTMLRERVELQVGFKMERGFDDIYFKNLVFDEFQSNAARIEGWISNPSTVCGELESLRDAIEFKKINNKMIKDSIVEETIADIYTAIYAKYAEQLKNRETAEENRVRMRVDNILVNPAPNGNDILQSDISFESNTANQDQTTSKRRFNIITHREVIRRAEALMTKPPPIATPKPASKTLPSLPVEQGKSPGIAVIIPPAGTIKDDLDSPAGSAKSLHDSADDESELSDIEEHGAEYETPQEEGEEEEEEEEELVEDVGDDNQYTKAKAPLFPNLFGVNVRDGVGESDAASEADTRNEGFGKTVVDGETPNFVQEPGQAGDKTDVMAKDIDEPREDNGDVLAAQDEDGREPGTMDV